MTEDEKVILIETEQRSKSNTDQIEEIKSDIKEIKQDQKAIYELTYSVKAIAENVANMKSDLKEVKQGQSDLSDKLDTQIKEIKTDVHTKMDTVNERVNNIEQEPYKNFKQTKREIIIKIASGIGIALATGILTFICTSISNGIIKI